MALRLVGAELFRADRQTHGRGGRQTDMTKQTFAFHNYANAFKNELMCECNYLLRLIGTTLFPYSPFEKSQVEAEQRRLIKCSGTEEMEKP